MDARRRVRTEDPRLLVGRGAYVSNIPAARAAEMKVVRSPHAHARIRGIDISQALAMPGVLAVWTGEDVADWVLPIVGVFPHLASIAEPALATGVVRHVGAPVVAVVATDRYTAADAAEAVVVDYEPLAAVVDLDTAEETDTLLVHPELGTNVAYLIPSGPRIDFDPSDVVVRERIVNQRVMASPMEGRAVLADFTPGGGRLTVHLSTQAPHLVRTQLAQTLRMPESRVRVVAGDVGGAFGSKFGLFPEEVLASVLSRHVGRPVRWIEERSESAVSSPHGRAITADVELAATRDGRLTGIHVRMVGDLGSHIGGLPPVGPFLACQMLPGPYRIPRVSYLAVGVLTNTVAVEPYRGYYRSEATFVVERAMELLARQLGIDPVELRRMNLLTADDMPFSTATGEVYDSGDYPAALDEVLARIDYPAVRARQVERRRTRDRRLLGVGVSPFVWRSSFPTTPDANPNLEFLVGGWEMTTVRVERTGGVTVRTGASPHGQGLGNALAVIVGERLGVDPSDVEVISGDTDTSPYGMGSAGSRSLVVAGSSAYNAAERVVERANRLAAHLLEAAEDDLEWDGQVVHVRGTPSRSMDLYDLGRLAHQGVAPPGMDPGLEASAAFDPTGFVYPYGAHACVVEVDLDTGVTTILQYVAVDDCGRLLNPMIVEGQVHGGLAQGIAQALSEEAVYDQDGNFLNPSFALYGLLSSGDLPSFETVLLETPTPRNPLGAKGAGEAGTIGAPPVVTNAVLDALDVFGVRHLDMPLLPQKVWEACLDLSDDWDHR